MKNRHFHTITLSGVCYTLEIGIELQDESVRWYFDRAVFENGGILKFEFSKMSTFLKFGISKMCKILVEDKKILSLRRRSFKNVHRIAKKRD